MRADSLQTRIEDPRQGVAATIPKSMILQLTRWDVLGSDHAILAFCIAEIPPVDLTTGFPGCGVAHLRARRHGGA